MEHMTHTWHATHSTYHVTWYHTMTYLGCRVALPSSPDDTVLAAVSIKGTALLAWIQHVLSAAPFFAQTSQVSIARRNTVRRHCPPSSI
jgi:hypothetical protein